MSISNLYLSTAEGPSLGLLALVNFQRARLVSFQRAPTHWYNHEHRHSAIRFVTPAQRHALLDQAILDQRVALYEAARQSQPLRWKGATRNWTRIPTVYLNPDRDDDQDAITTARNQERKVA